MKREIIDPRNGKVAAVLTDEERKGIAAHTIKQHVAERRALEREGLPVRIPPSSVDENEGTWIRQDRVTKGENILVWIRALERLPILPYPGDFELAEKAEAIRPIWERAKEVMAGAVGPRAVDPNPTNARADPDHPAAGFDWFDPSWPADTDELLDHRRVRLLEIPSGD